jgi:predicted RNA-binding protein YlxR (DUF448 family)
MRTCTGCRKIAPQRDLVRLVFDGPRLAIDLTSLVLGVWSAKPSKRPRRLPGRGAYVHPAVTCVTVAGLSRSLRRPVTAAVVSRLMSEMSPTDDNSGAKLVEQLLQNASQNAPGLDGGDTVEMPPRIKAKDDRSEDARL